MADQDAMCPLRARVYCSFTVSREGCMVLVRVVIVPQTLQNTWEITAVESEGAGGPPGTRGMNGQSFAWCPALELKAGEDWWIWSVNH